jgi:hypothetical protein
MMCRNAEAASSDRQLERQPAHASHHGISYRLSLTPIRLRSSDLSASSLLQSPGIGVGRRRSWSCETSSQARPDSRGSPFSRSDREGRARGSS